MTATQAGPSAAGLTRTVRFLLLVSLLTVGGAGWHEYRYQSGAAVVAGEVRAFARKPFASAQEDAMVMEIVFRADGGEQRFTTSRNVVEQLLGRYEVGARVPVLYHPLKNPPAKIAYWSHVYSLTLTFAVLACVFLLALGGVWWRMKKQ